MQHLPEVDGTYRTAAGSASPLGRRFPSFTFHVKFLWIVFRCAFTAMRGKYGDQQWAESSMEVLRALESVGVEFEVTGLDNIRKIEGPCLVVGNHMSSLETTVLPGIIAPHRRLTFVVKEALLNYPIFKHVMRSRDPIAVSQRNPRADLKAMLKGGVERLNRGVSLVIFPEGERAGQFSPERFNSIGVKLASRAEVPIVPLALETSVWGIGRLISEFGPIDPSKKARMAFGSPLSVDDRGDDEHAALIEFITDHLSCWNETTTDS